MIKSVKSANEYVMRERYGDNHHPPRINKSIALKYTFLNHKNNADLEWK